MRVTYWCGPSGFDEWVPIESTRPFVKKHAVSWFWQRGAMCPDTVDQAQSGSLMTVSICSSSMDKTVGH